MDDPTNVKESCKNGQSQPGNQHAQKHGGAGALRAIQEGQPFTGLAAAREKEVQAAYASLGPGALIERNAIRLQVVNELYYDAFMKAAQDGSIKDMESALKVWGWVVNSSIRALDLAGKQTTKDDRSALTQRVLDAIKQVGQDDTNE